MTDPVLLSALRDHKCYPFRPSASRPVHAVRAVRWMAGSTAGPAIVAFWPGGRDPDAIALRPSQQLPDLHGRTDQQLLRCSLWR
jgi:hypothetical protein